jgi:hypothetical protein
MTSNSLMEEAQCRFAVPSCRQQEVHRSTSLIDRSARPHHHTGDACSAKVCDRTPSIETKRTVDLLSTLVATK